MNNPLHTPAPESPDKSRDVIVDPRARRINPHRRRVGEGTFVAERELSLADERFQSRLESLERKAGVR